jgi:catecholate siderophore receptor
VSGTYALTNANAFNCKSTAGTGANNAFCFTDVNGNAAVSNLANLSGRSAAKLSYNQSWHLKTTALTAMDTVDLTDRLTAFGGLRADHFNP